jgi:hypothetical protein
VNRLNQSPENPANSPLTYPDIRGCQARESQTVSWDSARFNEPSRLESITFSDQPILPVVFVRSTKRWPCEVTDPRPRARIFCLLVDPGDICPPHRGQVLFASYMLLMSSFSMFDSEGGEVLGSKAIQNISNIKHHPI